MSTSPVLRHFLIVNRSLTPFVFFPMEIKLQDFPLVLDLELADFFLTLR